MFFTDGKEFGAVSKQNIIAKPQINIINITNFHRFKTRLRRRARGEPLELKTGGVYVGFLKIQKVWKKISGASCLLSGLGVYTYAVVPQEGNLLAYLFPNGIGEGN